MARKISMEITTELARTFGYSKAKFEKRIETMTKYLPPGPDREQAAAQIREQEQGVQPVADRAGTPEDARSFP